LPRQGRHGLFNTLTERKATAALRSPINPTYRKVP